jgi:2-methylcitrate dehydratase PrpD
MKTGGGAVDNSPGHDIHGLPKERRGLLTRRCLLQQSACVVAAGLVAKQVLQAAEEISPVMAKLSAYMGEARNRALPDTVTREAVHHILDTIAAMVSGAQLAPGGRAIEFVRAYGGPAISTVVGSQVLCGPMEAALANAELAQSDESDDVWGGGGPHPGAAIVPAVLALGEQAGISGRHFVRAVTLGYDIGVRALETVGAGVRETHNLLGTMGAAAASGCALSLNAQQMRWLLDYGVQQAGAETGSWRRDTEHVEKSFVFAGMSARNGVTAALLVHSGWSGVNDVLSGEDSLIASYVSHGDAEGMVKQLGERYDITLTSLKKWTTGGGIQSPLDALDNLIKQHRFEANQVQHVVVRAATDSANAVNNREMPDICLQHIIAVMLLDKTVSFAAAHDKPRMKDRDVLRERVKVELIPDDDLQRLSPKRIAIVEVTLNDGTRFIERVEAVRGTPENPMSRGEVIAKARDLMTPVVGASACTSLINRILAIESVKDVRELRPFLQKG